MKVNDGDYAAAIDALLKAPGGRDKGQSLAPAVASAVSPSDTAELEAQTREMYDLALAPHPRASQRFPIGRSTLKVDSPIRRSLWRRLLMSIGWLVAVTLLLLIYHLVAQPKAPTTFWSLLFVAASIGSVLVWFLSRHRGAISLEVSGYDAGTLAQIPGFDAGGEPFTLCVTEADSEVDADDVIARRDGVTVSRPGLRVSNALDLELDVGEAGFHPRDPVATISTDIAEDALLLFASELEQALSLPAGSVWVTYPLLCVAHGADGNHTAGVELASVVIRGAAMLETERVCDAIVYARDQVLTRYHAGPLGPRVDGSDT